MPAGAAEPGRHAPLLLLLALLLLTTGCGGGNVSGGSFTPAPITPAPSLPTVTASAARSLAATAGLGNPQASTSVTGTISGKISRVSTKGKAAASGAKVVTDNGTYAATVDAEGNFTMTVPASRYTLTIWAPGYRSITLQEVPVVSGKNTDITSEAGTMQSAGEADTDRTDPQRPVAKAYVGSSECKQCHQEHFDSYFTTRHSRAIRYINDPADKTEGTGVVADFAPDAGSEVKTLSFTDTAIGTNTAKIELRKTEQNRYFVALLDKNGTKHEYEALRTHGGTGEWKQRFQTRIGGSWYTLPIQWNEKEPVASKKWVKYNVGDWYNASGNVRVRTASRGGQNVEVFGPTQANSYERKCYGCHGAMQGIHRVDALLSSAGHGDVGDWIVDASSISVSCENCHGPGYPHTATRDVRDIVNPSKNAARPNKLAYARANEVCGQCHVRGESVYVSASVPGITETTAQRRFEYPWTSDDKQYRPGMDLLATAYDIHGTSKYWNSKYTRDIQSYQHHQQWLDQRGGAHSFDSAQVTCFDCHDAHGRNTAGNPAQLKASPADNSLCLQCHGKDGRARTRYLLPGESSTDSSIELVTAHTKHAYDPANSGASRCVTCHMPRVSSSAIRWDISAHSMRVIKPIETLDMLDNGGDKASGLAIPHSCANPTVGCHNSSSAPGGNFLAGFGDLRNDSSARGKLVAAVNGFESRFGTRTATGTDVASRLGAIEGTVFLSNLPMEGARVMTDRGEDYDETGADGKFRLLLPKGKYNIYATHPSFKTTSLEAVQVASGAVNGGYKLVLSALPQGESQFVGSQKCKTCHSDVYDRWQNTLHNNGIRYIDALASRNSRYGVVSDFGPEGVGRTIRSTESDFSALGTAEIRLSKQNGVYTIALVNGNGTVAGTYTPERTYGGGRGDWKQRFVVKIGESSYILPIQWSESRSRWKTYNLTNWFNTTTKTFAVPARSKTFEYQCSGCHATGFEAEYRLSSDTVYTKFTEMNTGCESCHGPGGSHYRTGDLTKILNPSKLATNIAKLDTCTACHGRGDSVAKPNGSASTEYGVRARTEIAPGIFRLAVRSALDTAPVFAYGMSGVTPFFGNDVNTADARYWTSATWTVTSSTADASFSPVASQVRTSIKHHQQGNDFHLSRHFAAGITCWSCHDPHGSTNKANLIRKDEKLIVNEQINQQSLCLTCHGPSGSAPVAARFTSVANLRKHIHGGFSSHEENEASFSCTSCHMPKTASTIEKWDIKSHSFQAIDPQVSLDMWLSGGNKNSDATRRGTGTAASDDIVQNACSGCHPNRLGSLSALKSGASLFRSFKTNGGGRVQ